MDFKSLQVFQTLAQLQHFGKAAEAMHTSPSTISRTISKLEEQLGTSLVLRDSRQVDLTLPGQKLLLACDDILGRWQRFKYELEHEQSIGGRVDLYCSVTASYSIMPRLMKQIRQRYQDIEVHLTTGDAVSAVEKVASKEIDISIAPRPSKLQGNIEFKAILQTPLVFIAPLDEAWQFNTEQYELAQLPFVLAEQGIVRDQFERWAKKRSLTAKQQIGVSGHEAIISMVALGYGVGLVPLLVLQHSPLKEQVKRLAVEDMQASFDVGFCCRKSRLNDPLINAIWNLELAHE